VDYRKLFVSPYVAACDLESDRSVTIKEVKQEEVKNESGTDVCPIVYFAELPKPLVMNKTNAKRIATMYGPDTDHWIGKQVTLYASETTYRGEVVPCVRVRPNPPVVSVAAAVATSAAVPA
jgi:hypothetical protein